ncbi:MAG TPA: LPS export ABC transporter periplasmic protein LptC [Alphaproteobacteria bacterium]|nr:LPS export ABC transporter periplasmic protein LptC [Alphaproteobacteria bacterium]
MAEPHPTDRPGASGGHPRRQFHYVPVQRQRKLNRWHSRFVGLLKFVLPTIAVVLMALVALWPELQRESDAPTVSARMVENQDGTVQMMNPRYFGVDQKEQPFSIVAQSANQLAGNDDIVELAAPDGEITLNSGAGLSLRADTGRYDRAANQLNLSGDVTLLRDDGVEVRTSTAEIDLDSRSAQGDQPIHAQGPTGEVQAEGFRITDGGATVIFTGRSKLTIRGDSGREASE